MSQLDREKDPEILHKAIDLLQHHNRALTQKIAELVAELALAKGDSTFQQLRLAALEKQLAKLTKLTFGPSADTRAGEERPAGASTEGDDKGKNEPKKKSPGHGPTKQRELPHVDVEHGLD